MLANGPACTRHGLPSRGLHQVRLDRVLEEHGHALAGRLDVFGGERLASVL